MSVLPARRLHAAAALALVGAATTLVGAGAGASYTEEVGATQSISTGRLAIALSGDGTATGSAFRFTPLTNQTSTPPPATRTVTVSNTGTLAVPRLLLGVRCSAVRNTSGGGSGAQESDLCKEMHLQVKDDRGELVPATRLSAFPSGTDLVLAPRTALAAGASRSYTFTYSAPERLTGRSMDSSMTVDAVLTAYDVA